ncbi:acetate--CoA ligase family protein [Burkholderia pyrrocinia]|uniref:Acetate--CoA ligase family protein n=1 Tax=Burkholderia pyrrocinia TaxID=60550 RepID=A0ABZ3BPY7_BURPY
MSFEAIRYDVTDGVAEIQLNRSRRLNAVVQELYDGFNEALNFAEGDPHVRVVLTTGEGRAFCVGADLKEHKAGRTVFERREYLRREQVVSKRLLTLTADDAHQMLEEVRAAEILNGVRGALPTDKEALVQLMLGISGLCSAFPEIEELDLNPVLAYPSGIGILDVRILLEHESLSDTATDRR